MRTTNSRDKYSKQPAMESTQTRMLKTSTSTRAKPEQPPNNRPASGKKIQSTTSIPAKVVKKDYVVEQNMTESRIYEAKQGLQLLKKKMSTKGMSREKVSSMNRIPEEKPPSLKTAYSQKTQTKFQNLNSNIPPRKTEKKISQYEEPPKKPTPKIPTKKPNVSGNTKIQQKQPSRNYQEYNSPEQEAPISQKKDFNALLQEELRKEAKKQNQVQSYQSYDENPGDVQLVQCSQGCGRMFSVQAIEKHEKICQKVFQSKRKAFDSAAHRAPESEGFDKGGMKTTGMPKKREEKKPAKQQNKGNIPKWKAESLAFRASMKAANGKPISKEEKEATECNMVQCKFCGRKFNQTAAQRHIPFCETKSKQLPKKKK